LLKQLDIFFPVNNEAIPYSHQDFTGYGYRVAVKAMYQAGIIVGGTDNSFNPKGSVTRAEVAAMIYNYIKQISPEIPKK